eukprot:1713650-Alexandrium_andersonii.AAC.1
MAVLRSAGHPAVSLFRWSYGDLASHTDRRAKRAPGAGTPSQVAALMSATRQGGAHHLPLPEHIVRWAHPVP